MSLARPQRMTVNAVSLMFATIATNALGFVFWIVAARVRGASVVGGAFAEIAALTLLATLVQLNMTNVFIRLLPVAGRFTATFIARGYLAVTALALIVGSAFVASGLGGVVVPASGFERALFVLAVALFAIFALQDSVLTALRIAHWVPAENVSFASVKLALLPLLAFLPPRLGIVLAWMLPVAVAVIAVNVLLFRGPVGRTRRMETGELPGRSRLLSFIAAEYACMLCATATLQVIPLIVLWRLGAISEAYFSLPWLACLAITLLLWNIGAAFVVAVTAHPDQTPELLRRSLRLGGAVVLAAVLGCCLAGPLILRLAGPGYEHGASLMRLVGLSAPFTAATVIYSAFAWIEQRLWRLVAIQAGTGLLLIALSLVLLPDLGIAAVGWAYIAAQSAAAILMAPSLRARLSTRAALGPAVPLKGLP